MVYCQNSTNQLQVTKKTIGKEIGVANKKRRTIGLYPIKLVSSAAPKSKEPNAKKEVYKGLYDY
jgi:hypothetical protein